MQTPLRLLSDRPSAPIRKFLICLWTLTCIWNSTRADIDIVAITNQAAPDENGVYASLFGIPMINEAGEIAYLAQFAGTSGGTDNNIAYLKGNLESQMVLARKGDLLPSENGTYTFPSNFWVLPISIDEAGNVNSIARITGSGDNAEYAMIHFDEEGAIEIVRDKQTQSEERVFELDNQLIPNFYHPIVSDDGEIYFFGIADGLSVPQTFLIYRWSRETGLEYVIGNEEPVLENTTFGLRGQVYVSSTDKIAISSSYLEDGDFAADFGIAEWTRDGGHRIIVRNNDVTPDGLANFTGLGAMTIQDTSTDGRVLISSFLQTSTGNPQGIFVESGSELIEVAVAGKEIDGEIPRNGITGKLGATGTTWFTCQTEGRGTFSLFRHTSEGAKVILKEGDPVPGLANATFENVGAIYPNESGDVLFFAFTRKDGLANSGYYLWTDCGVFEVAIVGQALAESTIQTISIGKPIGAGEWPHEKVINDEGQVAFHFQLQDGRAGVGIWTPPPPLPLPQLFVRLDNEDGVLSFTGDIGLTYQIQKLPSGGDWAADWSNLGDPIIGNAAISQLIDPGIIDALNVFYRLRLAQ